MTEPLEPAESAWLDAHLADCPACHEIDAAYRSRSRAPPGDAGRPAAARPVGAHVGRARRGGGPVRVPA